MGSINPIGIDRRYGSVDMIKNSGSHHRVTQAGLVERDRGVERQGIVNLPRRRPRGLNIL
ncbi:hypothetical protein QTI66_22920 [Variovorax sp. J22R133]|uniref:hypothetical protein n=1 Tax=Variovorax brevis TaxID=3053503 RepID=UPI002574FD4E|nr:hypothetical protein [Variovorax sp. J22R133]MDM0115020.1 hypothetical protein [Variovorax sp. J22R133]